MTQNTQIHRHQLEYLITTLIRNKQYGTFNYKLNECDLLYNPNSNTKNLILKIEYSGYYIDVTLYNNSKPIAGGTYDVEMPLTEQNDTISNFLEQKINALYNN